MAPHFQGYQRGIAGGAAGYPITRPAYGTRSGYGARPAYGGRSGHDGDSHHRRPYERGYRSGAGYIVPGYGWVGPYLPSYLPSNLDDSGYDDSDSSAAPSQAYDGSDAQPPYPEPPPYPEQPGPFAAAEPTAEAARPAPAPANEEAVTLIFKDGRPPEQIHNYVLTRTTLFVRDQQRRAIPTDQLDLVATAKANRDAGVDFQLPEAPK